MTKKKNHEVVQNLSKLLADSYVLLLKTQNYHWNVTGPDFSQLHALFQTQYEDLDTAIDEIAERIRALGEKTPGSFAAFSKLTAIKEETASPDAEAMLQNLASDQEQIVGTLETLLKSAQEIGDEGTADIAIQRIKVHQKNHWMLKSHLA